MKLDIVKFSIDFKTGKEIGQEVVGQKEVSKECYYEACVRFLTGKSVKEFAEEVYQHYF